jgi:hypothetical protein
MVARALAFAAKTAGPVTSRRCQAGRSWTYRAWASSWKASQVETA